MPSPEAANGSATLTFDGSQIELPSEKPTLGRTAIDISSLAEQHISLLTTFFYIKLLQFRKGSIFRQSGWTLHLLNRLLRCWRRFMNWLL